MPRHRRRGLIDKYYDNVPGVLKPVAFTANKALKLASSIARDLNVEKKYADTAGPLTMTGTANVTALNAIAQGDGGQQRDGDQAKLTSVQGKIWCRSGTSGQKSVWRVLLVHDKQSDGTAPTLAEILARTSGVEHLTSPYNMDNSRRFKILMDKAFELNAPGVDGDSKFFRYYKKLNLHTRFNNAAGATSSIASNGLFIVLQAYDGGANTNYVQWDHRVRFVDN